MQPESEAQDPTGLDIAEEPPLPAPGRNCCAVADARREPRAAIETIAQTPYGPLHVVAAHLGLSFRERHHQVRKLAQMVRRDGERAVLMGDLNDWAARSATRRVLNGLFPGHSYTRTFPASWPLLPLDRIYCRPRSMLHCSWTDCAARSASDHLSLIADLALDDRPPRMQAPTGNKLQV